MRDDLPDENGTDPEPGPWQFRLRTLFAVTFLAAVFFSMVAWWGAIIVTLVVAGAVGAFLGAWMCPALGLDNPFGELKWDVAKSFGVSTILVGLAYASVAWIGLPHLLVIVLMVHFFLLKAFWFELDTVEIVIIDFGTICALGIAGSSIAHWLAR